VDGKLYGILNLSARREGSYDKETRTLLSLLAFQLATVVHNASLYQRFLRQQSQLKKSSEFKNKLLSNLSCELKSPLNSIIGLSELMAEGGDGPVNSDQVAHLSMIRQSGQKLINTVSSMLDLSKIEANRLELDIKHISLGRLLNNVTENVKLNKNTSLFIDLKEEIHGIYGDEARLKEVLYHLIENAAKFTKRGKITVEASKVGEMAKVCVRDTGTGIRKEHINSLFDGFIQKDGNHSYKAEGLGIGLTLSRKIVELHGGRMWFKSRFGRGSEFFFTLPLKPTSMRQNEI